MDMIPVASSQIESIGYDSETLQCRVRFVNGSVYEYDSVNQATVDAVMGAASVGKAFNLLLKYGFSYRRLE